MPSRCVTALGAEYRVHTIGSGPPVVLHPSLGRPADDFHALATALAVAGYQALALDPPGVSTPLVDRHGSTLHDLAAEVWDIVDQLGLGPVALLGHAFGNRIVRTAATARPDQVTALVLLACGGEVGPKPAVWDRFITLFDADAPRGQRLGAMAEIFFAPGNDPSPWQDGWYPEVAAGQTRATGATPHADYAGGGSSPLLVVQGLDDRIAPPQNAWNLVARRADTRVLGLPRCGHAMLPEQPRAIATAVRGFLDEKVPATGSVARPRIGVARPSTG